MQKKKITLLLIIAALVVLAGCELTAPLTYNNPYAGDWYELTQNLTTWDAVKLALSDKTFEISTTTFDADGENPGGYEDQSKGDITYLSESQIFMATTELNINGTWYTRGDYISHLVDDLGFAQIDAEDAADDQFTNSTVIFTVGSNPRRLILGSGAGTGDDYTNMTYYTSVFAAKNMAD